MDKKKKKVIFILSAIVAIEIVCIVGICTRDSKAQLGPDVAVRWIEPQAVLYTVYRGHYEGIGPAINKLYDVARVRNLTPIGPHSTGYLNNPLLVSDDHWLIEIRIPVSMDALELAGTLGEMTDVKLMPAMKVVTAVKPEGQLDPEPVIRCLYALINRRGYRIAGGMWQSVLYNNGSEDYSRMRTEFMIPVL
jgi:hypothetical protein